MSALSLVTPPRASLAERQAALVAALTGHGPVPAGFDADRVQAAADALAAKRARGVAQAWPGLHVMLGEAYRTRFDAYALASPLPPWGGPIVDGRRFVAALALERPLHADVALQALAFDQRWKLTEQGAVARRWPRVAVLRVGAMLVVAVGGAEWRVVATRGLQR